MKSGCSRFFPGASKSAGADLALQSTQGQIALISRGRGTLVNCNIPGVRFGSPPAKGSRRNKFTFCCRPPGPLARRERRAIPGAVCEERATKPASLRAAARRGAAARARIGFVAAPRRCPTSPSSRRLASARPALAPKCEFISARALSSQRPSRAPWLISKKTLAYSWNHVLGDTRCLNLP